MKVAGGGYRGHYYISLRETLDLRHRHTGERRQLEVSYFLSLWGSFSFNLLFPFPNPEVQLPG